MGIITSLIEQNHRKKYEDTVRELDGYKAILALGTHAETASLVKPETLEWAMDNIAALADGKKAGSKSAGGKDNPFKTLLKGMVGGLSQLNPSPGAPKQVGERPQQMFRSPEEQKQFIQQQQTQEAEGAGKTAGAQESARQSADLEADKKRFEVEQQQAQQKRKAELTERLKAADEGPFSPDQKQQMIQEAWSDYTRLGKPPQKPTTVAAKRAQLVQDMQEAHPEMTATEAETAVARMELSGKTGAGSVAKDKENIALGAYAEKHGIKVEDMTDAQKQEALSIGKELGTGELKVRSESHTILDNPSSYTPAQVKAAKETLKALDTKQQGATLTVVNKANEAAADASARAIDAEGPTGPAAKKLRARAAIDPSMDLAAWDWLAYEKFDVRGLGKSTQADVKQIKQRAGQIMDDLGLSPGDVFAIRAGLKGNTAAFSKITTVGAQVAQFEETLKLNSKVARDLSDAYKRSDIQLINRVLNAYKTGTGDDKALNLAAQLHGVAREWAKIMAGSTSAAGVPISEAADADKLIGAALSNGQLDSLFDNVILKDANNRSQAIQGEAQTLLGRIKGSTSAPTKPPQSDTGSSPKRKVWNEKDQKFE